MNPDVKQLWIAALLSGDYQQGQVHLRSHEDRYCCLGVLSELAILAGVIPPAQYLGGGTTAYCYDGYFCVLPLRVRDWAGLTNEQAALPVGWNDEDGLTFPEIAEKIRTEF
jgi:hypothetical protein